MTVPVSLLFNFWPFELPTFFPWAPPWFVSAHGARPFCFLRFYRYLVALWLLVQLADAPRRPLRGVGKPLSEPLSELPFFSCLFVIQGDLCNGDAAAATRLFPCFDLWPCVHSFFRSLFLSSTAGCHATKFLSFLRVRRVRLFSWLFFSFLSLLVFWRPPPPRGNCRACLDWRSFGSFSWCCPLSLRTAHSLVLNTVLFFLTSLSRPFFFPLRVRPRFFFLFSFCLVGHPFPSGGFGWSGP